MSTEIVPYPGRVCVCHIKVDSVPPLTPKSPQKQPQKQQQQHPPPPRPHQPQHPQQHEKSKGGGGGGGGKAGRAALPANALNKLSSSARVTSGPALQRAGNANAVIRVTSLGGAGGGRGGKGHHRSLAYGGAAHNTGVPQSVGGGAGSFADLRELGLDCVHVGQCWLDTGIALVGDKNVSFRLYCQRENTNQYLDQHNSLVIRLGSGGRMRQISDGDCLIKLRARIEVSKKGHAHWTAIDCVCVISKNPLPVLVSCGVAVLKRHPSTGKCMIAMKRCGQSIGFVSMRRQLKRYFSALAAYREPLVSPQDIAAHFDMCCNFELDLLSKPLTVSNVKCLFESRSSGPVTYNEAWTSMFEKHQMFRIPALTVLEVWARMSLQRRTDSLEDLRRPWTLPKGNFRHMAASGFQTASQCAVRELKAETSLEWNVDDCTQAPSVTVALNDSAVAVEKFFLWRSDTLPENGGQVGEKYWQWFEFDEAKRRSMTAAAIITTAQCHKLMGLKDARSSLPILQLAIKPSIGKKDAAVDKLDDQVPAASTDGENTVESPSASACESADEPVIVCGKEIIIRESTDEEKSENFVEDLKTEKINSEVSTLGEETGTSDDEAPKRPSIDDIPSPKKDFPNLLNGSGLGVIPSMLPDVNENDLTRRPNNIQIINGRRAATSPSALSAISEGTEEGEAGGLEGEREPVCL
eukprot:scpid13955/ scgid21923/ 